MLELRKLRFWTLAAAIGLSFSPALAEQNEGCGEIAAAVNPKGDDKVAPVPEQALSDVKTAVSCLAGEIEKFGADVRSDRFDHRTAEKLLSATEALRTIMTRGVSSSDAQEISPELKLFIDVFRSVADNRLRIISALSFGMRDDNPQLRLNSALILGNVIRRQHGLCTADTFERCGTCANCGRCSRSGQLALSDIRGSALGNQAKL